ncbi:MAG: hypothetical protein QM473_10350 [Acidobacteriota bacterium]|nr:hypothetical protein [Acidobacteriota bacterium]
MKTVAEGVTFYKLASSNEATLRQIARYTARFGVSCVQVRKINERGFDLDDAEALGHYGLLGEPEAIGACLAQLVEELAADVDGRLADFEYAVRKVKGEDIPLHCEDRIDDTYKRLVREDVEAIACERERLAELTIAETPVNGGVTA